MHSGRTNSGFAEPVRQAESWTQFVSDCAPGQLARYQPQEVAGYVAAELVEGEFADEHAASRLHQAAQAGMSALQEEVRRIYSLSLTDNSRVSYADNSQVSAYSDSSQRYSDSSQSYHSADYTDNSQMSVYSDSSSRYADHSQSYHSSDYTDHSQSYHSADYTDNSQMSVYSDSSYRDSSVSDFSTHLTIVDNSVQIDNSVYYSDQSYNDQSYRGGPPTSYYDSGYSDHSVDGQYAIGPGYIPPIQVNINNENYNHAEAQAEGGGWDWFPVFISIPIVVALLAAIAGG